MSDVSQGSGWWIASDGRWYPPEQHPNYVAPLRSAAPVTQVPAAVTTPPISLPVAPPTTTGSASSSPPQTPPVPSQAVRVPGVATMPATSNGAAPGDQRGPDWWQASDGNWYPPQLHPSAQKSSSLAIRTEYCTTCGAVMNPAASVCASCQVPRLVGVRFCWHCASPLGQNQVLCTRCGVGLHGSAARGGENGAVESKRIVAGALAFFVGAFGVHKFYLGNKKQGFLRLCITIFGAILILPAVAMMICAWVEAVIYLTKTDADFIRIYQQEQKAWF